MGQRPQCVSVIRVSPSHPTPHCKCLLTSNGQWPRFLPYYHTCMNCFSVSVEGFSRKWSNFYFYSECCKKYNLHTPNKKSKKLENHGHKFLSRFVARQRLCTCTCYGSKDLAHSFPLVGHTKARPVGSTVNNRWLTDRSGNTSSLRENSGHC
jgi:hypothetical protein